MNKWIRFLALALLFVGIILVLVSQSIDKSFSPEEIDRFIRLRDGPIVYGTSLTGYFRKEEKINVIFDLRKDWQYFPDLLSVKVGIEEPDENETLLTLNLKTTQLISGDVIVEIAYINLTRVFSLEIVDTLDPPYIGTVMREGNYTFKILEETLQPDDSAQLFSGLVLIRRTLVILYPYSVLLYFGGGVIIIGVVLLILDFQRSHKRRARYYKQRSSKSLQ